MARLAESDDHIEALTQVNQYDLFLFDRRMLFSHKAPKRLALGVLAKLLRRCYELLVTGMEP